MGQNLTNIKPFNFSRLQKLSRRQLEIEAALKRNFPQLLEMQEVGKSLSASFEKELNLALKFKFLNSGEKILQDFVLSFASPCVTVLLGSPHFEHQVILELDYALARRVIDQLLGGDGEDVLDRRALTSVEEGVLEYLILKSLNLLNAEPTLKGIHSLQILKIIFEPKMLLDTLDSEQPGCIFKFYLEIGGHGGSLRFYFPHPLLEGVLLRNDLQDMVDASKDEGWLEKQMERVSHIKAVLVSEIGRVELKASEQAQLEKGDVVLFDDTLAKMDAHGLTGKAILRVENSVAGGLLAEIIDIEGKMVVKILDYYGG